MSKFDPRMKNNVKQFEKMKYLILPGFVLFGKEQAIYCPCHAAKNGKRYWKYTEFLRARGYAHDFSSNL